MTDPDQDLLITTEGVDEGSARSTVEGLKDTEAEPAPPVPIDSQQPAGPGLQLEAGEG